MKRLTDKIWNGLLKTKYRTIDGMPWWRGLILYCLFMTLAVIFIIVRFVFRLGVQAWRKANMILLNQWHLFYPMAWWN